MRARVIENKVIVSIHYLGFTLETEEQVVFTASQTGRSFRHSDGRELKGELAALLGQVRKAVGIPSEIPALLPLHRFAGQVIDLPDDLLK